MAWLQIFGHKEEGIDYFVRVGTYAVIFKDSDKKVVGLIRANGAQYFLPGGGIEAGENDRQCLKREFLEETGYSIRDIHYLGHAVRYFRSTLPIARYMLSDGHFYTAWLNEKVQEQTEKDNFLEWISVSSYHELIYHQHQAWAIEQALKK